MACERLSILYAQQFDVAFPALNYPPLMLQYIQRLALPLDIHTVVNRISNLLSCTFTFPKPGSRQRLSSLPEIQLICMLVVAVKLYHPFDNLQRALNSSTEMGLLTIDWDTWNGARKVYDADANPDGRLTRDKDITMTERDVFNMSALQMDDYLDWYEKTWIDDEDKDHHARALPDQLLNMFPTGRLDGSTATTIDEDEETRKDQGKVLDKLEVTQKNLMVRDVILEATERKQAEPVRRIGSSYKQYRGIEDLTAQAKAFYEATASIVGVSLPTLVKAVYRMETALRRWRDEQEKKQRRERGNLYALDTAHHDDDQPDPVSDSLYSDNDNI
ncbi:MAG: hypothetical protein Q9187_004987 [Circinaria calcarea]